MCGLAYYPMYHLITESSNTKFKLTHKLFHIIEFHPHGPKTNQHRRNTLDDERCVFLQNKITSRRIYGHARKSTFAHMHSIEFQLRSATTANERRPHAKNT